MAELTEAEDLIERVGVIAIPLEADPTRVTAAEWRAQLRREGLDESQVHQRVAEIDWSERIVVRVEQFAILTDGARVVTDARHGREHFRTHLHADAHSLDAEILASVERYARAPLPDRWQRLIKALEQRGMHVASATLDSLPFSVELQQRP
jgi:aldehyde:ferredoxin oxidoreductase